MSVRVLGVGIGLFLVVLLWVASLLICLISSRSRGGVTYAGLGSCIVTAIITIILISIPRSPETPSSTAEIKVFDQLFVGRIVLLVAVGISAIVGLGLLFVFHFMEPVYAKPLSKIKES